MFKAITIYRLPAGFLSTVGQLEEFKAGLQTHAFIPCGQLNMQSAGWVAPAEHGDLVHGVNGQLLIALCTEKKILPGAVITRKAKERAVAISEQQGFKAGRKQLREIKEVITDELLPAALSNHSTTLAWIDTDNGWLVIDSASDAKATDVIKMLLKSVGNLPLGSLNPVMSPGSAMTSWLELDEAPIAFTIDQDAELVSSSEGRATVRFKNQTLDADDVRRHIASGKHCTQLAMTWNDRISFVLTEAMTIKRITPLDILRETSPPAEHAEEQFDADLLLMAGELHKLISDLVLSLGGEQPLEAASVQEAVSNSGKLLREDGATATVSIGCEVVAHLGVDGPDPRYDEAVKIVREKNIGSISLVQRYLSIGYNRAARLLERMENEGVVSAMRSNGTRAVLAAQPA